ncbi:MAG: hypothetical protein NTY77_04155 [Elusimicrobia bacterium]|nr:hypothetical protein [Elusimicrobiota bacterium]
MALESVVDLAQPRPALSPLPSAPVLARQASAGRDSRGGAGLVRLAALALFAAGMASTVAFNTRPPAPAAAAPRPAAVFAVRTPAAAPAPQSLARTPASGEVRSSSPVPFYGGADQIAAVGADAALPSASSQIETGRLVPFFQPAHAWRETAQPAQAQQAQPSQVQAQPRAQLAKAFRAPHLRPTAHFIGVTYARGWGGGALRSSAVATSMIVGGGPARPCRNARPRPAFAVPGDGGGPQPARQAFAVPGGSGYGQRPAFQVPQGFAVPGDQGVARQMLAFQVPQGIPTPGDGGGARQARQAFPMPGDGGGARQACNTCP